MLDRYDTLFVFEGNETEDNIVSKLEKNFMGKTHAIKCVYGADIYQLYRKLKEEDFVVDIVSFLKERSEYNRKKLDGYGNDSFSYVYFFFDYDAHATKADDKQIIEMLDFFNNETDQGKLFISYPMVEAIKHFKDKATFKDLCIRCKRSNCPKIEDCPREEECLKEPHYKEFVTIDNDRNIAKLDSKDKWDILIDAHLCKGNLLVNNDFSFPNEILKQDDVFNAQLQKYINLDCPFVAVLSAFPLFALDYYGVEGLRQKME